ncbi:MAG: hypothetical protein IKU81_05775 [Oscillibacter sp.]|nr:hypothetical protein [Oscillibacter sp.]
MELNKEAIRKNAKNFIEVLNQYAAGIALMIPAFVAISTSIIKYLTYIQEKGRADYFSVPSTGIEVFNPSILFDLVFSTILFAVVLFNTYVFFLVFQRKGISVVERAKLFLVAFGMTLFMNYMVFLAMLESIGVAIILTIFNFLNALAIFLLRKVPRKKEKSHGEEAENTQKDEDSFQKKAFKIVLYFVLVFALVGSILYYGGQSDAKKERTFRMVDDTHIVVYENSETYYSHRCDVSSGTVIIYTNIDRQYVKTEVETEWKTFSDVVLQPE